jgi:prepilin-type N-terminal cleavage/methylation domain-containing protein
MKKHSGFTLIELLVVIAIIGILASVILASLNTARVKARDAARKQTAQQLRTAFELYYNDNGVYPLSPGGSDNAGYNVATLSSLLTPTYITSISNPSNYIQYVRATGGVGYGMRIYSESQSTWCLVTQGQSTVRSWWGNGGDPSTYLPICS